MAELIVSLDVPERNQINKLVALLGDAVSFYKIGPVVFCAFGPAIVEELRTKGKRVFLDLKFFDIPNTVREAVKSAARMGVDLLTLHLFGGGEMVRAACEARDEVSPKTKVIGVTVLTSMDDERLHSLGIGTSVRRTVENLAAQGREWGADGIVCSGEEIPLLRPTLPPPYLMVCPGIRPGASAAVVGGLPSKAVVGGRQGSDACRGERAGDDQKRIVTPGEAVRRGADFLVVGRPIYAAEDPGARARAVLQEMQSAR